MNKKNNKFICTKCGGNDFCYVDGIKFCNLCGEYVEIEKDASRTIRINSILHKKIHTKKINIEKKVLNKISVKMNEFFNYEYNQNTINDLDHYKKYDLYDVIEGKGSYDVMDREDLTYIEDEDGLNELLDDKELYENNFEEEFPGLIVVKKTKLQ